MAESGKAFKNLINREVAEKLAEMTGLPASWAAEAAAGLDDQELKARVKHLAAALRGSLDEDYEAALARILNGLGPAPADPEAGGAGIEYWVLCQFVEDYGLDWPGVSMAAIHELTQRFSCEFAIRPYLLQHPAKTMLAVKRWVKDSSPQVRRLCSEGTRPRLPWGMRLQQFIENPLETRFILDRLVDDPAESVRRSVANHLNDISKDHPEVALEIARGWLRKPSPAREKAVRHALRTLIKKGDPAVMELFGYHAPELRAKLMVEPARLRIGGTATIELALESTSKREQKVLLDYVIHYRKANGKLSPKVFKWTEKMIPAGGRLNLKKGQSFQDVSIRKHYPGGHVAEVQVNGLLLARREFELEASNADQDSKGLGDSGARGDSGKRLSQPAADSRSGRISGDVRTSRSRRPAQ